MIVGLAPLLSIAVAGAKLTVVVMPAVVCTAWFVGQLVIVGS